MSETPLIRIRDLQFAWPQSGFALAVKSLEVARGECVAIVGPSGSGKTTLLNLLAGIYPCQAGEILVGDSALHRMNDAERRRFRLSSIGMVFQQFELVPYLRAVENVLLPRLIQSGSGSLRDVRPRAMQLLAQTGLAERTRSYPAQLSQGEQQRLALCRALLTEPTLMLADEPTGNLDQRNKHLVLDLMLRQVRERQVTLLMVTHDTSLLDRFDRVLDFAGFTGGAVPQ